MPRSTTVHFFKSCPGWLSSLLVVASFPLVCDSRNVVVDSITQGTTLVLLIIFIEAMRLALYRFHGELNGMCRDIAHAFLNGM